MIVRVKLFAAARELAGIGEVPLELANGATIADVERALVSKIPGLEKTVVHARWAVDASFVARDRLVSETAEIALIPPVSGG